MTLHIINSKNQSGIISDVYLHPLKVNRDESGILVETLRVDWPDKIYDAKKHPFAQQYYSVTSPGVARDDDLWHVNNLQEDRFLCPRGDIIVAIYDNRSGSPTKGKLNLFEMGQRQGDNGQYILLIPKNTLHGFMAVGDKEAVLLNFPTQLYNKADEGRIPYAQVQVKIDGEFFSWDLIRKNYRL